MPFQLRSLSLFLDSGPCGVFVAGPCTMDESYHCVGEITNRLALRIASLSSSTGVYVNVAKIQEGTNATIV